jgi:hypothetical protein
MVPGPGINDAMCGWNLELDWNVLPVSCTLALLRGASMRMESVLARMGRAKHVPLGVEPCA